MKTRRNLFQIFLLGAALLLLCAGPARATTFYVDVNSTNPTPPYADWSTAATNHCHPVKAC